MSLPHTPAGASPSLAALHDDHAPMDFAPAGDGEQEGQAAGAPEATPGQEQGLALEVSPAAAAGVAAGASPQSQGHRSRLKALTRPRRRLVELEQEEEGAEEAAAGRILRMDGEEEAAEGEEEQGGALPAVAAGEEEEEGGEDEQEELEEEDELESNVVFCFVEEGAHGTRDRMLAWMRAGILWGSDCAALHASLRSA